MLHACHSNQCNLLLGKAGSFDTQAAYHTDAVNNITSRVPLSFPRILHALHVLTIIKIVAVVQSLFL